MKNITKISLNPNSKRIVHIIIYIIFIIYSVNSAFKMDDIPSKIILLLIVSIVLFFAIYADYLEGLSNSAIKALNYDCDPDRALEILNKLEKKDFVNHYKKGSNILLKALISLAKFETDKVIQIIEGNDKIFRASLDMLYIRNTTLYFAYIYADNKTQAKRIYPEIIKLRGSKVKGKKLSPVYSWEELEALYYLVNNDFKKAAKTYKTVNMTYMNNKEKAQVLYYKSICLVNTDQIDEAKESLNECISIANKLPFSELAKKELNRWGYESTLRSSKQKA